MGTSLAFDLVNYASARLLITWNYLTDVIYVYNKIVFLSLDVSFLVDD